MKQRIGSLLFVGIFLVLCVIPGVFTERDGWISLRNRLLDHIFQTSGTDQVIVGEEGWLYYGETAGHFTGEHRLTEAELQGVLDYLAALQTYFESRGQQFIFVCAPNKNTVYPDCMPANYLQAPGSDAARIYAGMQARGIPGPDVLALFGAVEGQLYHKLDSHWNNLGAATVADAILTQSGKDLAYAQNPFTIRRDFDGDLAAMLYPDGLTKQDEQVYYNQSFSYRYTSPVRTLMDMEITTRCDGVSGSLFMVRDSFGSSLLPFLAEGYGQCYFTRKAMETVLDETTSYDVVVLEIAERNLRNLLKENYP